MAGLTAAINDAKTKAETLTDRIRQQKGLAPAGGSSASASPAPAASAPVSAPKPASIPTPSAKEEDVSTVALSGMAEDLSEFETKIKKLKVLRDNGILSEEEYIEEKKKLVSIF